MFLATTVTRVESYGRRQKLQEGERSSASLFPVLGLLLFGGLFGWRRYIFCGSGDEPKKTRAVDTGVSSVHACRDHGMVPAYAISEPRA